MWTVALCFSVKRNGVTDGQVALLCEGFGDDANGSFLPKERVDLIAGTVFQGEVWECVSSEQDGIRGHRICGEKLLPLGRGEFRLCKGKWNAIAQGQVGDFFFQFWG